MSEPKKQSFLHGTMLLALSTAIVKVLGAIYSVPLNRIIGSEGFSYYSTAYEIYTVLLMISTAGLPVAMSRMISAASSVGNYRQVRKIYSVSRIIFLSLGLVGTLLMVLGCRWLANVLHQPDAWAAIGILGPCCFLICMMSAYRGFFQGQSNMMPTSVSQVLESLFKLAVGIGAALLVLHYNPGNYALAAAGAIGGVTVSCLVSILYLGGSFRKSYKTLPASQDAVDSSGKIAKGLLAIAIPITIGSAGLQILTVLETERYMGHLVSNLGQSLADTQKGVYNMTQKIFNMPCAFITPITISIIPAITAHLTRKENALAKSTGESAARVAALISAPCAVGLAVLAEPITALLGGFSGEKLMLSTQLMIVLGICILFNAIVLLTNAIMQAHGHVNLPVVNMFAGGIVKLVTISILTANPQIGILGAPIGSLLCYLCITVLNLVTMRKVLPNCPAILKNMLRSVIAAVVMGAAAFGTLLGLKALLGADASRIITCGVPIAVGGVVYLITAIKLKAITRDDCLLLPKGEKIAKLLHL